MNKLLKKPCFMLAIIASMLSTSAFSQSITLEDVIREACTRSDSVKMMNENIVRADAVVREKRSAAFPNISSSATIKYDSPFENDNSTASSSAMPPGSSSVTWDELMAMTSGFATPKSSTVYNGALSVSQAIVTFGKVRNAIQVAQSYKKSTYHSYQRGLQTLQLAALDMFYQTMIAVENARIVNQTLTRKKDLHAFIDRNFSMGSGEKARLMTAKADAYSQAAIAIIAQRDAETSRMYLNAFLGRQLMEPWTIDTSTIPEILRKNIEVPADMMKNAVEERSDILSLRYMAESNRGGAKIFRAMYFPSIYANGSIGYSQIESKGLMAQEGAADWTAGITLSWTLFDGFENNAKATQYLSDARKLEIAESTVKKAAEIEIRSAIIECSAADSAYGASRDMYSASKEAFELTNNNFRQGSGSLTDLQQVDEQLQLAELGLINARYRQIRSRGALLVALGRDIITIK